MGFDIGTRARPLYRSVSKGTEERAMGHGSGMGGGRVAASAVNKEFALHFAQVVVAPTERLNDMVARSG